jgi:hypothetical protein
MKMIVIQKKTPLNKADKAYSHPKKIAQMIFKIDLKVVSLVPTKSYPNGVNENLATLKNCNPTGMKIMVMQ